VRFLNVVSCDEHDIAESSEFSFDYPMESTLDLAVIETGSVCISGYERLAVREPFLFRNVEINDSSIGPKAQSHLEILRRE
jgi:hypothetical protein